MPPKSETVEGIVLAFINRDKQELAETQKELTKVQLTQDESKKKEEAPTPFPEPKKLEEKRDAASQQLALVLPHQVNTPWLPPRASEPVQQYNDQPVQQTTPSSLVPHKDRYLEAAPCDPVVEAAQIDPIVEAAELDPVVDQYISMGLGPEAISYAVLYCGDNPTKVKEFIESYNAIQEMGFTNTNVPELLAIYNLDPEKVIQHLVGDVSGENRQVS